MDFSNQLYLFFQQNKQITESQQKERKIVEELEIEINNLKGIIEENASNVENLRRTNYLLRASRYATLKSLDQLHNENEKLMAQSRKSTRKFNDLKTAQKRLMATHCETLKELELLKTSHDKLSKQQEENSRKLIAMEIRNTQLRVSYSRSLVKVETLSKKKSHLLVNFHRVLKEKQGFKKAIRQVATKEKQRLKQEKQVQSKELSMDTSTEAVSPQAEEHAHLQAPAELGMCFAEKC